VKEAPSRRDFHTSLPKCATGHLFGTVETSQAAFSGSGTAQDHRIPIPEALKNSEQNFKVPAKGNALDRMTELAILIDFVGNT
jgi:hypothetical protein